MVVGTLVRFHWWTDYKAPSITPDVNGHITWHELHPGDTGIIVSEIGHDQVVVLFAKIDIFLQVNISMLKEI